VAMIITMCLDLAPMTHHLNLDGLTKPPNHEGGTQLVQQTLSADRMGTLHKQPPPSSSCHLQYRDQSIDHYRHAFDVTTTPDIGTTLHAPTITLPPQIPHCTAG
jgi:hypothetical protein